MLNRLLAEKVSCPSCDLVFVRRQFGAITFHVPADDLRRPHRRCPFRDAPATAESWIGTSRFAAPTAIQPVECLMDCYAALHHLRLLGGDARQSKG